MRPKALDKTYSILTIRHPRPEDADPLQPTTTFYDKKQQENESSKIRQYRNSIFNSIQSGKNKRQPLGYGIDDDVADDNNHAVSRSKGNSIRVRSKVEKQLMTFLHQMNQQLRDSVKPANKACPKKRSKSTIKSKSNSGVQIVKVKQLTKLEGILRKKKHYIRNYFNEIDSTLKSQQKKHKGQFYQFDEVRLRDWVVNGHYEGRTIQMRADHVQDAGRSIVRRIAVNESIQQIREEFPSIVQRMFTKL